jgi:hypothetical protein
VILLAGALVSRAALSPVQEAASGDVRTSADLADARWSHKVPLQSGKIDYAVPFEPGVIQVILQPGVDLAAALKQYNIAGATSYANSLPFTDFDRRAGLDRSFRVAVPVGNEKDIVVRLASDQQRFLYVGLFWIAPPTLDLQ